MTVKVTINKAALNRKAQQIQRQQVKRINRSGILQSVLKGLKSTIRKGINPKTGRNYKKLEKSTRDYRKFYAGIASTHPRFSPNKANVTFSGQVVDSLKAVITAFRTTLVVTLRATGTHKGHKLKKGGTTKAISNAKLVEHLADAGYPILAISKKRIRDIRRKIVRKLNRI